MIIDAVQMQYNYNREKAKTRQKNWMGLFVRIDKNFDLNEIAPNDNDTSWE